MANKKLTLSFDEKVIERVDVYASSIGVNRTAAITFLIMQGLTASATPELLNQMSELMKIVEANRE